MTERIEWKRLRSTIGVMAWAALVTTGGLAHATMLERLELADLTERAERIFRGEVVALVPGTLAIGGGTLPVTEYRVRVSEALKGSFEDGPRGPFATFRVVGSVKARTDLTRSALFLDVPRFGLGEQVLLFLTAESSAGLSAPVGLGQGAFEIDLDPATRSLAATNRFGNVGLTLSATGPIGYSQLRSQVLTLVEGGTP